MRSASAQCGVVKRDVTNCLKERAEAALNCFCTTGDTLAAWPHPPGLPAFHQAGRGGGECWPSTNPASLALNPYIPWLPTLLVAQLGTSHLQTKCLMSSEPVPPITGTTLLLTAQRYHSGLQKPSQLLHHCFFPILSRARDSGSRCVNCRRKQISGSSDLWWSWGEKPSYGERGGLCHPSLQHPTLSHTPELKGLNGAWIPHF